MGWLLLRPPTATSYRFPHFIQGVWSQTAFDVQRIAEQDVTSKGDPKLRNHLPVETDSRLVWEVVWRAVEASIPAARSQARAEDAYLEGPPGGQTRAANPARLLFLH